MIMHLKTTILRMALAAIVGCMILAITSCRTAPQDLSGRWTGQMRYTEGRPENSAVELLLVQHGEGLAGTLRWQRADNVLVEFRISAGVASNGGEISLDGEGGNVLFRVPMTFEGKVERNVIRGTVKLRVPTGLLSGSVATETGELTVEKS
jgi:hypothetical protein